MPREYKGKIAVPASAVRQLSKTLTLTLGKPILPRDGAFRTIAHMAQGTFVADQWGQLRILQHFGQGQGAVVDENHATDQANSMTVIRIPIPMNRTERLNGKTADLMPTVDGDFLRAIIELIAQYNIFLVAGNQFVRRIIVELQTNHPIMA